MEAKKSFTKNATSRSLDRLSEEVDPSMLTTFLETSIKLLSDSRVVKGLQELINKFFGRDNAFDGHRAVRKIGRHKMRTRCDMRLIAQVGEYEMDQIILDMESDENVFPKDSWGKMGRLALQWSLIQLRMENQQNIIPMGKLHGVTVDIEGVSALAKFEVIDIVDEINPYPPLLGID